MKRGPFLAGLFVIISFLSISCDREYMDVKGDVELYLLKSFDTTDQFCAIELSSVVIENKPLIKYSDFKSYNAKEYFFKITDKASDAIENLDHSVHGLAFAVVADDQPVYTGYFWPSYSSASCQWIVIDPIMLRGEDRLDVRLGYPGLLEGAEIPDERNNQLILDIFKRDGKLID